MKKILSLLAITAAVTSSVYAQGFILAANSNGTKVSTNSVVGGAATGTTLAGDSLYYYAVFYSTTSSTGAAAIGATGTYAFNNGWTFSGIYETNSLSTGGRFLSASADANNSGGSAVTGLTAGASAYFTVVGWSANIGSTWSAVQTYLANPTKDAWVGQSASSGLIASGSGGLSTPPGIFGSGAGLIGSFTLGEVQAVATPEPGTMALAALGGASMLLFRRRK